MPPLSPTLIEVSELYSLVLAALPASLPHHPLVILMVAGATAVFIASGIALSVFACGAVTCYGLKAIGKRRRWAPLPLIAPWQRHALAIMHKSLPMGWFVHTHVNPVALIFNQSPSMTAAPRHSLGWSAPSGALSGHRASCRPSSSDRVTAALAAALHHIPFTITDSTDTPRAVIILTDATATRRSRTSDDTLRRLFHQHGIATHFLARGSRPDWRSLAQTIATNATPVQGLAIIPASDTAITAPPAVASQPASSANRPILALFTGLSPSSVQVLLKAWADTYFPLCALIRRLRS